jgi:hypothetical protein
MHVPLRPIPVEEREPRNTVIAGPTVSLVWLLLAASAPGGGVSSTVCTSDAVALPSGAKTAVPYGLDRRPSPEGIALGDILTANIGPFRRGPLETDALPTNADLNVEYRFGPSTVMIGLVVAASEDLARCAVRAARDMAAPAGKTSPVSSAETRQRNFAFVKTDDFVAWSRGRYFFYVKTDSAKALDEFMANFVY